MSNPHSHKNYSRILLFANMNILPHKYLEGQAALCPHAGLAPDAPAPHRIGQSHLIIPISSTDAQTFSSLFLSHHLPSSTIYSSAFPSPFFFVARSAQQISPCFHATLPRPLPCTSSLEPRASPPSHLVSLASNMVLSPWRLPLAPCLSFPFFSPLSH